MDKSTLRRQIAAQKRALTQAQILTASGSLAAKLFEHRLYRQASSIYGYLSYNQEVRTLPILQRALADGKRVAVPKLVGDELRFHWLDDLTCVEEGAYGIPEPMDHAPIADDASALVLMPGLAFDLQGGRLGYGSGFYDRFLAAQPHRTIALCYAFQVFPHIPREEHDIAVDAILSAPV